MTPTSAPSARPTRAWSDPDYPHHLTYDWDPAFRQQRVKELIFDRDKHDVASMRAAQADVLSPAIVKLQPLMIAAAQAGGSVDNAVLDQLTTWDATMRADRPEPLIFTAWVREAVRAIYRDDLGPAFDRYFDSRAHRADPPAGRPGHGPRLVRRPHHAGARELRGDAGCRAQSRAGRSGAALRHRPVEVALGHGALRVRGAPAVRRRGRRSRTTSTSRCRRPGGNYTLNRGKMDFGQEPPFANRHASSYPRHLRFRRPGALALHPHAPASRAIRCRPTTARSRSAGRKVEYIEIATKREEIAKAPRGTWRLTPK